MVARYDVSLSAPIAHEGSRTVGDKYGPGISVCELREKQVVWPAIGPEEAFPNACETLNQTRGTRRRQLWVSAWSLCMAVALATWYMNGRAEVDNALIPPIHPVPHSRLLPRLIIIQWHLLDLLAPLMRSTSLTSGARSLSVSRPSHTRGAVLTTMQ